MKMKKYVAVLVERAFVMMGRLSIAGSTVLLLAVLLVGCMVETEIVPGNTTAAPPPSVEDNSDQLSHFYGAVEHTVVAAPAAAGIERLDRKTAVRAKNYSDLIPNSVDATIFEFVKTYIDTNYGGDGKPGWTQVGDMDQDGDIDIVAGGGRALYIYENDGSADGWVRYGSLDGTSSIGANGGVLYDVDADNDLDVVSAKYYAGLGWWENPGGPLANQAWQFHVFSNENRYLHDIIVVDLDKDGISEEFITNLNVGYWSANITLKWFRPGDNPLLPWESHTIEVNRDEGVAHGHAGMDVGDIDRDGHLDLAFSNGWYEAPDNLLAGNWTWHVVSDIYGISNTLIEDMNGDANLDLLVSGGHHGQGVYWLENDGNPASGSWIQHNISAVTGDETKRHVYDADAPDHLHHPECLAVKDLDADGDQDIISCDLFFGEDPGEPRWNEEKHNVYIFENLGGSLAWEKHNIAPNSYPSHLLQLVDVNEDGRLDIVSESTGYSVVSYYENVTEMPLKKGKIEGTVSLQGRSNHSGVVVCADDGSNPMCFVTGPDGAYSIETEEGSYGVSVDSERYLDGEKLNVFVTAGNVTNLTPVTCLGGDSNDDCVVNILDLSLVGGRFNSICGDVNWDPRADINDDCIINILDLAVTGGNFGGSCPVPWD